MNLNPQRIRLFSMQLSRMPRSVKRILMLVGDSIMIPAALWCAIGLRFAAFDAPLSFQLWLYPLAVALMIPVLIKFGLYRAVVRFMGTRVVFAVTKGVLVGSIAFGLVVNYASALTLPVSVLIIFTALCLLYVGGSRLAVRLFLQFHRITGDRVVIYGAGGAGANLASALYSNQKFAPVAFLDDNIMLQNSVINGVEVFSPDKLPGLIETLDVKRVLLAVPSASRRRRRKIIEQLEKLPIHVQTMPDLVDLISGATQIDEIREVDVGDLLGRDSVPPVESLLDACIGGKVVMVTGAGGSIGSELCRQIIRQSPAMLLLFESSELALYDIDQQLSLVVERDSLNIELVPLLGSVQHKQRLLEVMNTFGVQTVYHAAAYKHVPLVEKNILAGISNNVFGTLHCAEAAIAANIETFVLISTDKAVCPTNVMGATKRVAEIVLQGLDLRGSDTRFCMVRFGNVLASSGSVVPLFREQIERGGPVTVTHPEIIRYFMTIPEAAQLVIQAGSMGKGGDLFLLDMGHPVRIEDLARRLIHLMGLTVLDDENPDGDIEIQYTGLRPAEKLYEELLIGNNAMGTEHPMIMRAEEKMLPWAQVSDQITRLKHVVNNFDTAGALQILSEAVEEYTPSRDTVDLVWQEKNERNIRSVTSDKVRPIQPKKKA